MKKTVLKLLLGTLLCALTLLSCRKQEITPDAGKPNADILNSVVNWLDLQQKKITDSSGARTISSLHANLLTEQLNVQQLNDTTKLIIIPLKNEFQTLNMTSKQTLKSLVVMTGLNNSVKGGIVEEIIPESQSYSTFPFDIVSQVYLNRENKLSGIVSYLTFTNRIMEERKYEDGHLLSIKRLSKQKKQFKEGIAEAQKVNGQCTDWYWQTYIDGELVSEEYAFTTCDGLVEQCRTVRTLDSRSSFKTNCGGGGGGDNQETIDHYNATVVKDAPDGADDIDIYGVAPKITYVFAAQIARVGGMVTGVVQDPVTISNLREVYIDRYGRPTTRILQQPYGQFNTYINLGTSAMLEWNWFVYGIWNYAGGDSYSKAWPDSHIAVG